MTNLYEQIVNKMVWVSDNAAKDGDKNGEDIQFLPFVTISRDPGSGGRPIAKIVAEKLGLKFYNSELITQIAKSADARKEVMAQVDEKQRGKIEDFIHSSLNPEYISERRYITHLCKVVLTLAQEEKALFLGRGANFILPKTHGLNVRVTAPYRVCVSRAVEYEKIPHQKARKVIREVTSERAGFVKQYFGKDVGNPKYYDLTINTSFLDMEQAADMIVHAYKLRF